ncbi:hypothetical protein ACWEN4_18840 [Streptomyces violaceorubidus]
MTRGTAVAGAPTGPLLALAQLPVTRPAIAGFARGRLGTMLSGRREAPEQRRHYEAVAGRILSGAVRRGRPPPTRTPPDRRPPTGRPSSGPGPAPGCHSTARPVSELRLLRTEAMWA